MKSLRQYEKDQRSESGSDEEKSVFQAEIQGPENSDICDNCFRRTHVVVENWEPIKFDARTKEWKIHRPSKKVRKLLQPKRFPVDGNIIQAFDPWKSCGTYPGTFSTCECGVISKGAKLRPLDKRQMIQHGERVCERLEESDYDIDRDSFFDTLRMLKEDPDEQFADEDIFIQATERAADE